MKVLKNKKVLVTGGARGIGKQLAVEFAQKGADIIIWNEQMRRRCYMVSDLSTWLVHGHVIRVRRGHVLWPMDVMLSFIYESSVGRWCVRMCVGTVT